MTPAQALHIRRQRPPRRRPSPPPAPTPEQLPPAAEIDRRIEVALAEWKLERARRDIHEIEDIGKRLTAEGDQAHCPACAQLLRRRARLYLRAMLAEGVTGLEVDRRYFEQRLVQLGEPPGFPPRHDDEAEENDFSTFDRDDDLPF